MAVMSALVTVGTMIIRIPKKYKKLYPAEKPGDVVERLVSFVDLAPTLLSLVETEAPDYMQGNAFLGKFMDEEPDYVYLFRDRMDDRYDMTRALVDRRYRYIRNYNSNRIWNLLKGCCSILLKEDIYIGGVCSLPEKLLQYCWTALKLFIDEQLISVRHCYCLFKSFYNV